MATLATARFEARLTRNVHALLKRAAELEGRSLSDFVISAAQVAAQKTIAEKELIALSVADQMLFAEALINPPKPNDALQKAFQLNKKLFGDAE